MQLKLGVCQIIPKAERHTAIRFVRKSILGRDADTLLRQAQYELFKGGRPIGVVTLTHSPSYIGNRPLSYKGKQNQLSSAFTGQWNLKSTVRLADDYSSKWEKEEVEEDTYGAKIKQTDWLELYNRKEALGHKLRLSMITMPSYLNQYKALVQNPPFYYINTLNEKRDKNKLVDPIKGVMVLIQKDFMHQIKKSYER